MITNLEKCPTERTRLVSRGLVPQNNKSQIQTHPSRSASPILTSFGLKAPPSRSQTNILTPLSWFSSSAAAAFLKPEDFFLLLRSRLEPVGDRNLTSIEHHFSTYFPWVRPGSCSRRRNFRRFITTPCFSGLARSKGPWSNHVIPRDRPYIGLSQVWATWLLGSTVPILFRVRYCSSSSSQPATQLSIIDISPNANVTARRVFCCAVSKSCQIRMRTMRNCATPFLPQSGSTCVIVTTGAATAENF